MRRRREPFGDSERQRVSPWRGLFRFIIILTLPCYCIACTALMTATIARRATAGGGWTPWLVLGGIVVLVVLLTEPLHGAVSAGAEVGLEVAETGIELLTDPLGCLLLLFVSAVAVVVAAIILRPGLLPSF